jgi:hypothetical protein
MIGTAAARNVAMKRYLANPSRGKANRFLSHTTVELILRSVHVRTAAHVHPDGGGQTADMYRIELLVPASDVTTRTSQPVSVAVQ